ncbi:MAG: lactonase family protein [Chitinophagia bacterium]|jgi:6-phosphogluconolactonase|nr:lactonase family protein [Chitinophagia bacterium]NCA29327.1 lactonase family protein [Chitinophagia bacterium]NDD16933.1 lactonase family protein [Chitinophagia bacterium]
MIHSKFVLVFISFSIALSSTAQTATPATTILSPNLLVGTYTKKGSKGIYVLSFDTVTGKATEISHTDGANNPSFLTISKDHGQVYAVNEGSDGKVSAYSFIDNKLNLIQEKTSKGADPCYISLSPDQTNLFVANYSGGSITSYHRFADGRLSNPQQFIQHEGKSVNEARQEKAHVHGVFFSPDGKYLLTPDLGMDEVSIYPYQTKNGPPLQIQKASKIQSSPGAGPRHLSFSSNGKFVYVIEELTGSISVYRFYKGIASFIQKVYTHPKSFKGVAGSADIHLSPDGLFLYASNRGTENNIISFKVLPNGKLEEKSIQYYSTEGKAPRNFTINKEGTWLLVANQDSDNIIAFRRNIQTGSLTTTGVSIKLSMPVCLLFY